MLCPRWDTVNNTMRRLAELSNCTRQHPHRCRTTSSARLNKLVETWAEFQQTSRSWLGSSAVTSDRHSRVRGWELTPIVLHDSFNAHNFCMPPGIHRRRFGLSSARGIRASRLMSARQLECAWPTESVTFHRAAVAYRCCPSSCCWAHARAPKRSNDDWTSCSLSLWTQPKSGRVPIWAARNRSPPASSRALQANPVSTRSTVPSTRLRRADAASAFS